MTDDIKRLLESDDPGDRARAAEMMIRDSKPAPASDDKYSLWNTLSDIIDTRFTFPLFRWPFRRRRALTVDEILVENQRFDHSLKKQFGRVILWLVIAQVALANVMIFAHFFFGAGKDVEASVMIAWISGTVVEAIGLMAIVTKYLFDAARNRDDGAGGSTTTATDSASSQH